MLFPNTQAFTIPLATALDYNPLTPISLQSLGFVLYVGHDGSPCPLTVEVCAYAPSIYVQPLIQTQGIQAAALANIKMRNTNGRGHMHNMSLTSIQEDMESPVMGPQRPTLRETPQPDGSVHTPVISDTLFDHPVSPLDSDDISPNWTYTAPSKYDTNNCRLKWCF